MTKAVIFDLDGTLLDTLEDLADSCNKTLSALGYPSRTLDEIKQFVGNGIPRLMRLALPGGTSDAQYAEAVDIMRGIYAENCAAKTKPYDGIEDLMRSLSARGIQLAVVSNKPDAQVKDLCALFFAPYIQKSAAIGDATNRRRKPFPDSVYEALNVLGVPKKNAVYVGDSEVDIDLARNVGMRCISVLWGFRSEKKLLDAGAVVTVSRPCDILNCL